MFRSYLTILRCVHIVACRPVTRQRPRNIQVPTAANSRASVEELLEIVRDTGFSDFVHRPYSRLLKTQRFGNWLCFRRQVREDTYSVGSLRKSYPQSHSSFRNVVFLVISNPDDGQSPKTQYLCVLYTIVRTI
jgi:hypothetical protein